MSQMRIGDGTGNAYAAKVDEENRLSTYGPAEHQVKSASKKGDAFGFGMNDILVPGNNVPVLVLWTTFEDPNRNYCLDAFMISWNGGSTTYAKPLLAGLNMGTVEPTANHVVAPTGNMNLASTSTALMRTFSWNNVGVGMTTAFVGQPMTRFYGRQGTTVIPYNGGLIIPKGISIGIQLTAPEAGVATIFVGGWFE